MQTKKGMNAPTVAENDTTQFGIRCVFIANFMQAIKSSAGLEYDAQE